IGTTARKQTQSPNTTSSQKMNKPRGERAGPQAVIGEILSEEDHQAAQRKLGAAQLRIAKGLNRITTIGAIFGLTCSLGFIVSLVITKFAAADTHIALLAPNRAL